MTPDEFAAKYGIEEGIFDDISDFDYHFGKYRKCLGSSAFSEIEKSALHFKTWRDRPAEDLKEKDHFIFGKAYHINILEPHLWDERFHPAEKIRRSTSKGAPAGQWKELLEAAGNKTVLWHEDVNKIILMKKALLNLSKTAAGILNSPGRLPNQYERTYIWKDDFGIWCKCRTDIYIEDFEVVNPTTGNILYTVNIIGDLKSTTNASPFGFGKSSANYGYDIQAAHYVQGVNRLTHKDHEFIFIAQEKEKPFAVLPFLIDRPTIMKAAEKIFDLKQRLAQAFRTGIYEAYPDEIIPLQMPGWYK